MDAQSAALCLPCPYLFTGERPVVKHRGKGGVCGRGGVQPAWPFTSVGPGQRPQCQPPAESGSSGGKRQVKGDTEGQMPHCCKRT